MSSMAPAMYNLYRICPPRSRVFCTSRSVLHENPLGLPRSTDIRPPQIPRRGLPQKRNIPNVRKTVIVASGKGGVGKSTVAVNVAAALASSSRLRVGILDLDVFGPSIPTLMGLTDSEEPRLTPAGALIPITNHGIPCMSMGFLLPRDNPDAPIVWRGLMVQKAIQQLLFDVDWRIGGAGLDVLVIDMPPGTGDVPLSLGQLVNIDGSIIVTTPQDVALADVTKGISMLRKISIPITGVILNQSHFICSSCSTSHYVYGSPTNSRTMVKRFNTSVLAELPIVESVSSSGDDGVPFVLKSDPTDNAANKWKEYMLSVADHLRIVLDL